MWRFSHRRPVTSSAIVGGGVGEAAWIINLGVAGDYGRLDPADHLAQVAAGLGLRGPGVAMMTAAPVARRRVVNIDGALVCATVGIGTPTWAATEASDPRDRSDTGPTVGTINVVAVVPADVAAGAMVNLATTITEAKTQALLEAGIPGTGTATDAVCVVGDRDGPPTPFGGPRSTWGGRIAIATYRAVSLGLGMGEPSL